MPRRKTVRLAAWYWAKVESALEDQRLEELPRRNPGLDRAPFSYRCDNPIEFKGRVIEDDLVDALDLVISCNDAFNPEAFQ